MPTTAIRAVDVYPYRHVDDGPPEFLLLRRAADVPYAEQWRMVGGKIQAEETAWAAAYRELKEETGQAPIHFWALPSTNQFYEWQHDRVTVAPAFGAEITNDPVLNHEHNAFTWLPVPEAAERLAWPEQQRLVQLAAQVLRFGIPPSLVISDAP
ncbi:NUDIX domain-containing protein [Salisaeta longa]|uniref:NUDIX domain-containing protein n=1 Tax=Salisaeta longa TaxID=503170 RepID=UPI0006871BDF|nr:NUDIX domain-containing protein [Salisaeta longa]